MDTDRHGFKHKSLNLHEINNLRSVNPCLPVASSFIAIHTLSWQFHFFPAHARRGKFHGFINLNVAGAATNVSGKRFFDRITAGVRILLQKLLGRQQETGRAVTTLRGTEVSEGPLQRMKGRPFSHALNTFYVTAISIEPEH